MSTSPSSWDQAKQQAIRVLRDRAKQRDTISYSEFVRKIKAIKLRYHRDDRLDQLLDEISLEEDAAGRGLISVLVVEKVMPRLPAEGFFELAAPRHPPGASKREIFELERDRVFEVYAG